MHPYIGYFHVVLAHWRMITHCMSLSRLMQRLLTHLKIGKRMKCTSILSASKLEQE